VHTAIPMFAESRYFNNYEFLLDVGPCAMQAPATYMYYSRTGLLSRLGIRFASTSRVFGVRQTN